MIRACRHLGISYKKLMRDITGTDRSHCPFLIIPYITKVALLCSIDPEEFLLKHTAFPYATAFMSQAAKNAYRDLILLKPHEAPRRVGALIQSALDAVPFRRYCPLCCKEDILVYGESHWRLHHNLPAVYICSIHKQMLRTTTINMPRPTASKNYTLPGESPSKDIEPSCQKMLLSALADESNNLFIENNYSLKTYVSNYRENARNKGYQLIEGSLASYQLACDLNFLFGSTFLEMANAKVTLDSRSPWPSLMVRDPTAVPFSPVKHLLMKYFLRQCPDGAKEISYPRPGKKKHDCAAADKELCDKLLFLINKKIQENSSYTITELLIRAGSWQRFRHNRKLYPNTRNLIKSFLQR